MLKELGEENGIRTFHPNAKMREKRVSFLLAFYFSTILFPSVDKQVSTYETTYLMKVTRFVGYLCQ
jgi:hypothetical protein